MTTYIRSQKGTGLAEAGAVIEIGGSKQNCVVTDMKSGKVALLGQYEDAEKAKEVFEYIVDRMINPSETEIKKGIIYIDLYAIEKSKECSK